MKSSPSRAATTGSIPRLLQQALLDPRINSTQQSPTSPSCFSLEYTSPHPELTRLQRW